MALGIDGTPVGGNITGSASVLILPGLTTTLTNDLVIVQYAQDGVSETATTVTSPHLTFTKRGTAPGSAFSEWVAPAASTLTAEVITITLSGAVTYFVGCAFAISGADTTTKFDSNVSLPVQGNTNADPTFSTTSANTIVIAGLGIGVATPTPGTGWNLIYNGGSQFFLSMYKIFTTAQTGTTAAVGTGSGQENRYVVDGIIQASGGSFTLACATGSYAMTGEAATFGIGSGQYNLIMNAGAYDYTGGSALSDLGLNLGAGIYTISAPNTVLTGPGGPDPGSLSTVHGPIRIGSRGICFGGK